MTLYAIYHRPTNTFSVDKSFGYQHSFFPFGRRTKFFNNIGPAKAFITNAAKEARRTRIPGSIEFVLALEVIEMEIAPLLETPVYSAQFNLDKL